VERQRLEKPAGFSSRCHVGSRVEETARVSQALRTGQVQSAAVQVNRIQQLCGSTAVSSCTGQLRSAAVTSGHVRSAAAQPLPRALPDLVVALHLRVQVRVARLQLLRRRRVVLLAPPRKISKLHFVKAKA
jgi:hypothetical protein